MVLLNQSNKEINDIKNLVVQIGRMLDIIYQKTSWTHLFNKTLKKTIQEAKLVYYRREFEYNRSNIKRTWSTINDILCKTKHSHQGVKSIISNGRMINDTAEIVNKFNEFFINIGPNLTSNVSRVSHETHHKYLTRNILTSFNYSLVDENHIAKTLASLRTKNSSGHDGISTKLLKFISPVWRSDTVPVLRLYLSPVRMRDIKCLNLDSRPVLRLFQYAAATVACHCFYYYFRVSIAPPPFLYKCINNYLYKEGGGAMETRK